MNVIRRKSKHFRQKQRRLRRRDSDEDGGVLPKSVSVIKRDESDDDEPPRLGVLPPQHSNRGFIKQGGYSNMTREQFEAKFHSAIKGSENKDIIDKSERFIGDILDSGDEDATGESDGTVELREQQEYQKLNSDEYLQQKREEKYARAAAEKQKILDDLEKVSPVRF